ncbi:MAG TPA: protein kinase [Ktedonobacterales bacterium]|nr:protein kinase [Ktedonobacterales bacterium]
MPRPALPATLAPGTVLTKRYRIEQLIGSGGYASVYRATDMTFGYERAIKEVTDPDPGVRKQFRLEAELLINSKHPNIPHGYHLVEEGGRLYLVMDYVHGKDLEELLNESLTQRQRPLDEEQVLTWALSICDALDVMHTLAVPVIHRDIKPANIKITPENHPILIDFGLAKLHHQQGPTLTAAQGVSPGFAPPEQYMAKGRTDARTDIYGLGATLYACLTGKDPPEAPGRLLAQTGAGGTNGMQLVPVRRRNPQVSEPTDRLILKALELSPNNRQQSARQLRDEMRSALDHLRAARGSTLVMGAVCHRCGTQNRPDATRCVHCNAPLAPADAAYGEPASASPGATGKRAALALQGGAAGAKANGRSAGPAPAASRAGPQPDQRTGRQAAVGMLSSGKQPAVAADGRTGKQPTPLLDRTSQKQRAVAARPAEPVLADARGATAAAAAVARPGGAIASLPSKTPGDAASAKAAAKAARAIPGRDKAWIRLGSTTIGGLGKVMLALAGIEALWGALVVALSLVVLTSGAHPPVVQLATGWAIVVVLVSVLAAQALARPIYRRGTMASGRRFLQGSAIILYSMAVQAAGIWGVNVFRSQQTNPTLAIASYALFGVSSLIAGVVGVFTVLG